MFETFCILTMLFVGGGFVVAAITDVINALKNLGRMSPPPVVKKDYKQPITVTNDIAADRKLFVIESWYDAKRGLYGADVFNAHNCESKMIYARCIEDLERRIVKEYDKYRDYEKRADKD